MTKKDDFIKLLREQVGVSETPPGSNKVPYNNFVPEYWCGDLLDWTAKQTKCKLPKCRSTTQGAEVFKGLGQFKNPATYVPQIGDYVFFIFNGKIIHHVGVVIRNNGDGTVTTVEGNTSPDHKTGSQDNGGEVAMKVRAYRADNKRKLPVFVVGFGNPDWSKV